MTIFWGIAMMGIAVVMLLIGGGDALSGLQNMIIVTAIPFAAILVALMISFAKDLRSDPLVIRRAYATWALRDAVKRASTATGTTSSRGAARPRGRGAGADFDSHDAEVTDWYQRTDEEGQPVDYDYAAAPTPTAGPRGRRSGRRRRHRPPGPRRRGPRHRRHGSSTEGPDAR